MGKNLEYFPMIGIKRDLKVIENAITFRSFSLKRRNNMLLYILIMYLTGILLALSFEKVMGIYFFILLFLGWQLYLKLRKKRRWIGSSEKPREYWNRTILCLFLSGIFLVSFRMLQK